MIPIIFAIPFAEMRENVITVYKHHPQREQLQQTIQVVLAEDLEPDAMDAAIVIARGMTYQRIQARHPRMPCVELVVHSSDIMRALLRCRREHAPSRIALMGHFPHFMDPEELLVLMDVEVRRYRVESPEAVPGLLDAAQADGCDAVVGGSSSCSWARRRGMPAVVVSSCDAAIRSALDEAIRSFAILHNSESARLALENIPEAVVYLDDSRRINYCNASVRSLLAHLGLNGDVLGVPVEVALPFMAGRSDKWHHTRFSDELRRHGAVDLALSYAPATVGTARSGGVLTLNTVDNIRSQEYGIREKLSRNGLHVHYAFEDILHESPVMTELVKNAKRCAMTDSNIVLVGETGTGKELFAQSIHGYSTRKKGPFVAVNCAALPEHLIESELFGYAGGAFTGARREGRPGLIETAHGGRCFWTRCRNCRSPCRASCSVCCRSAKCGGWGTTRSSMWTSGSFRRPTGIWTKRCGRDGSGGIYCSGWIF